MYGVDDFALMSSLGFDLLLFLTTSVHCLTLLKQNVIGEYHFVFCRYIPPLLWGKSGHLQTALYGKLGRVSAPHPSGIRKYLPMQDGATATFDLFEPLGDHRTGGDAFNQ